MKRQNYYLPAPQVAAMKKLAKRLDVSVAELVRRAVQEFLDSMKAVPK